MMELENINAEWARKRQSEIYLEKNSKYLDLSLTEIAKAVESGKSSVTIREWIPDHIIEALRQRGFDVHRRTNHHDGSYTEINW